MPIGRYVVPVEVMLKDPDLTVEILRLGAIANALNAVTTMSATSRSSGVGRDRDTQQTGLLVASYLKEAIDILDQKWTWLLIEKAVAHGLTLPLPVQEYRALFSRGRDSLYKRLLISLRSTKGFHVDPKHFQEWARTVQNPEITIWQRDGNAPLDWAFTISLQIQSFYGQQIEGGYDSVKQLGNAPHLNFLVEALCAGLMIESGRDFRTAWRPAGYLRIRIEYEFRDGRPRQVEHRVVAAESLDTLTGTTVHELRVRTAQVFGVLSEWKRTGVMLYPPDGGIAVYNTPRGSARVFAEGPAPAPASGLPTDAEMVIRLRGAGALGERQAHAALKLAEKVRDGKATQADADTLLKEFADTLDYWKDVERFTQRAMPRPVGDVS